MSIDPHAVLNALDIQHIVAVTPIAGGTDTLLWQVEHGGMRSALRVFRAEQEPVYRRERALMELAADYAIPVPLVRAHGCWEDRPALLLSWCAGAPLATQLRNRPQRAIALGHAFGAMQARIHQVPVPPHLRQAERDWITWYRASDPELETRLRRIAGSTHRLLHLDYHPLNVLVDDAAVSAVLDWANAHSGDPRADLARTYTILVVEPHQAAPEPRWYRAARHLLAWAWLRGYRGVAGDPGDLTPFYVWAGLVMQADLAPRVADPHSWWRPHHLQGIQRWTHRRRRQLGSPE